MAKITWVTCLFIDLITSPSLPISVHSDSQATIHIARNMVVQERTKHVELDCHFFRHLFISGLIFLPFVALSSQLADLFTKPLSGPSHHSILGKLGVSFLFSNLIGRGGVVEIETFNSNSHNSHLKDSQKKSRTMEEFGCESFDESKKKVQEYKRV